MKPINLIPEEQVFVSERRRRVRQWMTLGAGAVGLLMIPLAAESWRQAQAADLRGENHRLAAELVTLRQEVQTVGTESEDVFLQIERAKALKSKRAWSSMLNLISGAMPPGSWLTSIETDPAVPQPNAPIAADRNPKDPGTVGGPKTVTIEAPRRLRIAGYAEEPAEPLLFVTALNQSRAFQRVSLERTMRELVERRPFFRFEIACEW